jgi:DNA polymerase-1
MAAPLLLADVPWLLYRSFFALPKSIRGSDGRPVNALLGTVNAILAVLDARPARCVVACTGAEQARYRVELYAPYHAHREEMPAELAGQWTQAPALLESLGWIVADGGELEADDVMFAYARAEEEQGGRALLLTGDRDLYGAVSDNVAVLELRKGGEIGEIGPEQVRERYGVEPSLVPDFIALRGDPSDGLPGAPGIGAKTAAELLAAHGSLEEVLRAAEEAGDGRASTRAASTHDSSTRDSSPPMRPRTAAALCKSAEQLRAFGQIATLQRIPVELPDDRPTDFARGAQTAGAMGMKRLAERLEKLASS